MNHRAVIIAAGMGNRLRPLTKDKPKTTLPVFGKPIIEHIFHACRTNQIEDISLITGYLKEKLEYLGKRTFHNNNYENNNILHSLMNAKEVFEDCIKTGDSLVISYSDIYYKEDVLTKLLETPGDIVITADTKFENLYKGRDDNNVDQGELAHHNGTFVSLIGKGIGIASDSNTTEFIGLLKLSPKGVQTWLENFEALNEKMEMSEPFQRAKHWKDCYLTDFIQYLINNDESVNVSTIENNWLEFDTLGDYNRILDYETIEDFQTQYI